MSINKKLKKNIQISFFAFFFTNLSQQRKNKNDFLFLIFLDSNET